MDTPRPVAAQVMAELRALGIERLIMISGDNQQVADAVAKTVGLTEARGDLMPEHKVDAIKKLREEHGKVAMVGDGVNDAPAMANATVGIAMGAAGSDVALETADVALMADDLAQLPFAVGLSRSTSRIIKQNLWVSLGVVAVLIPATIFGLNIGTAVLFHEGSARVVPRDAGAGLQRTAGRGFFTMPEGPARRASIDDNRVAIEVSCRDPRRRRAPGSTAVLVLVARRNSSTAPATSSGRGSGCATRSASSCPTPPRQACSWRSSRCIRCTPPTGPWSRPSVRRSTSPRTSTRRRSA